MTLKTKRADTLIRHVHDGLFVGINTPTVKWKRKRRSESSGKALLTIPGGWFMEKKSTVVSPSPPHCSESKNVPSNFRSPIGACSCGCFTARTSWIQPVRIVRTVNDRGSFGFLLRAEEGPCDLRPESAGTGGSDRGVTALLGGGRRVTRPAIT